MSYSLMIFYTCRGSTQYTWACPANLIEMIHWYRCKAKQIISTLRTKDNVSWKRNKYACSINFLNVWVYLW